MPADEWINIVQPFTPNIRHVGSRHSSFILSPTDKLAVLYSVRSCGHWIDHLFAEVSLLKYF
jgi:hypothetical protein